MPCIRNIRERYDGQRRSPFDEAECGHHFARALIAWYAAVAIAGFQFSAVEKTITFAARGGNFFWSNGYAWGTCLLTPRDASYDVRLKLLHGRLDLDKFRLRDFGVHRFPRTHTVIVDEQLELTVHKS